MRTVHRRLRLREEDLGSLFPYIPAKEPLTGVVPRSITDVYGRTADIGGVVCNVRWSTIQPTGFGPLNLSSTTNGWGDLLTALGMGVPVKLRVLCGTYAPNSVKTAAGTLDWIDNDVHYTVPIWWRKSDGTTPVMDAWADLMSKLAEQLEAEPLLREVTSNPATTVFAEPFIRQTRFTSNVQQAIAAGLTAAKDVEAIGYPADLVAGVPRWRQLGWATTRHYVAFHPLQTWTVTAPGPPATFTRFVDLTSTKQLISKYAANLPQAVILGNNSFRVKLDSGGPSYVSMYATEVASACATSYQSMQMSLLTSTYQKTVPGATQLQALQAALDVGFGIVSQPDDDPLNLCPTTLPRMRARCIEVPSQWSDVGLTSEMCAQYNAAAAANSIGA